MSILMPTFRCGKITDINVNFLRKISINLVLLDIDNTIAPPEKIELFYGVEKWINDLKKENIKVILISNNKEYRVKPVAKKIGCDFIFAAHKPLSFKIKELVTNNKVIFIGDQLFTDILCANFLKIESILVDPIELNEPKSIKVKRYFENIFKKRINISDFT